MSILKIKIRTYLVFLFMSCSTLLSAQISSAPEYQVKAIFIYNFTQFVEWPASTFNSATFPFIIGIYGKNPFASYLEEAISGETVNGHPLVIQYYNSVDEIKPCQILFINKAEINILPNILEKLKGQNTLTVSDASNFLEQGGMVDFFARSNKIQIKINLNAVKVNKLEVSSKLLRVAEIFNRPK